MLNSLISVLWLTAIISICYYVTGLLEDNLIKLYYKTETSVSYGYGFYLITFTACTSVIGTGCTLLLMHGTSYNNDDRLIDNLEDNLNTFNNPPPPPPYNIPPPPYTP